MDDIRIEGKEFYRRFARVDECNFKILVDKIKPLVQRSDTVMRMAITVEERLSLTLKFLATGVNYFTLSHIFRIGKSTVMSIIMEVCSALYTALKDEYLKVC